MNWHIHWRHEISPAGKPDRQDWHCVLRHCRCGQVQYLAFGTFGDKKWHDIYDADGCQPWELFEIHKSAIHHGLKLDPSKMQYPELWVPPGQAAKLRATMRKKQIEDSHFTRSRK